MGAFMTRDTLLLDVFYYMTLPLAVFVFSVAESTHSLFLISCPALVFASVLTN